MNETITKNDDVSVKVATSKEEVISITDLKQNYTNAVRSLEDFEVWVTAERVARQEIVDKTLARIKEAEDLGVAELKP